MSKKTKTTKDDVRIAQGIGEVLKSQIPIVWSWGVDNPEVIKNGLEFSVQGFLHTGFVHVVLDLGLDLYEVHLLDSDRNILTDKSVYQVYFDQLIEIIDSLVEKSPAQTDEDYNKRVEKFYNLDSEE